VSESNESQSKLPRTVITLEFDVTSTLADDVENVSKAMVFATACVKKIRELGVYQVRTRVTRESEQ
jgi:phosphatidate phosphatase PAH1